MDPIAVAMLIVAALVVWGGLIASIVWLARRPETDSYPPGGADDERDDADIIERDT